MGFHRALEHLSPSIDLADAALLALARENSLYTIVTNDALLADRLRSRGASAVTLWELLSLAGAL